MLTGSMNKKLSLIRGTILAAAVLGSISAQAQFVYNSGDVLVCFRNAAVPVYDLIVDAGSITTFTNLSAGSKVTIGYTPAALAKVGTNNVAWCACAAYYGFLNNPSTDNTWMTRPRASLNTPTGPWVGGNSSSMSGIAGDIDGTPSLGNDATYIGNTVIDTITNVVETEAGHSTPSQVTGDCYSYWVGVLNQSQIANFNGDFQGVVEQTTPANFSTSGQPVRSDFYQLLSKANTPANTPGKYLGYFEFSTNGVMTYIAGPAAPTVTAIARNGTTNTISFTTVSGWTYSLLATNNLTAPRSTWPVISSSSLSTGIPLSLKDVSTNGPRFYIISVQ